MFPPATNNSLLISAIVIAEIVSSFNGEKEADLEIPISKQIISNSTRIAQAFNFIQDKLVAKAYCKHRRYRGTLNWVKLLTTYVAIYRLISDDIVDIEEFNYRAWHYKNYHVTTIKLSLACD